jgi:MerR family transcriptional regulator, repressor of the yfmOP operon
MTWLKIDDVAKETGLTKRTIRYYEEIGLIPPPERSEGGVRLYTEKDVQRLNHVLTAKKVLGFSLQELLQFIQISESIELNRKGFCSVEDQSEQLSKLKSVQKELTEQLDMIDRKMEKMQEFKKEMAVLLGKVEEALEKNKKND